MKVKRETALQEAGRKYKRFMDVMLWFGPPDDIRAQHDKMNNMYWKQGFDKTSPEYQAEWGVLSKMYDDFSKRMWPNDP